MGDRTSVTVYVWHEDKDKFIETTDRQLGEAYDETLGEDGFVSLSFEEVNYAGWDDLISAAEKGLRFHGYHGIGSDYGAAEFASSGEGGLQSAGNHPETGDIIVKALWEPGQQTFEISPESMERVGLYIVARNALLKLAAPD